MFRFRLQRVLDLRERRERDAAAALTRAHDAADAARQEAAALAAARDALAAGAPAGGVASVGARRTAALLVARMDEHVAAAGAAVEAAEGAVAERELALRAAFRDRRALDRLRERHAAAWRAGAAAAERRQMDELALTRFAQGAE